MSSDLTTRGRVIWTPNARGNNDEPLDALWMQTQASNATHLAREGNLRCVYEHPGSAAIWGGLLDATSIETFPWGALDAAGILALYCGTHRIRAYGETSSMPVIEARWRWSAPAGAEIGAVLVVAPGLAEPSARGMPSKATAVYTGAMTDASLTIGRAERFDSYAATRRVPWAPRAGTTSPTPDPDETGTLRVVSIFLGFYNTANSKNALLYATMRGATVSIRQADL